MADLQIPNLNKKNGKYLFKRKLTLRRKSKRKLLSESFLMFLFGSFLVYLNYLIPNKRLLFNNLIGNIEKSFELILKTIIYIWEIFLVIFIISSLITMLILALGCFYRLFKVLRRKTKQISYK